jgi:hypothetical protein
MSGLRWDKAGALAVLGAPASDESGALRYAVGRGGLELHCALWPEESIVELRLRREGGSGDLTAFALVIAGEVERRSDRRGEALRFANCRMIADRFQVTRGNRAAAPVHAPVVDAEIQVDPDLRISFSWRV